MSPISLLISVLSYLDIINIHMGHDEVYIIVMMTIVTFIYILSSISAMLQNT